MVYRIGIIGDVHAGSPDAAAPPEYFIGNDERRKCRVNSNKIQSYIYKNMEEAADNMGLVDMLVLMGDMCEGVGRKTEGIETVNPSLEFQVNLAVEMLSMFKTKEIISVAGSPYHIGVNLTTDQAVCDKLSLLNHVSGDHKSDQFIRAGKTNLHFRHVTAYRKKPDQRVNGLIDDIKEFTNDGYYTPDQNRPHVLVRGHTHYFEEVETRGIKAIINPCWKWRDEFVTPKNAMTSDMGYLMIDVTGSYFEPWVDSFKLPPHLDRSGCPRVVG